MALIGSDFMPEIVSRPAHCSECGERLAVGRKALVSIRNGKVQKRVCGENCRLEFDARFWDEAAQKRKRQ